jgi:hypothetical protein
VFTPLLAIPYAVPNGLTLFPEAAQQARLYPLTDPLARIRASVGSTVRFVRRVGNRLFDVDTGEVGLWVDCCNNLNDFAAWWLKFCIAAQLTNPEVVNATIRYAPEGQLDGVTDFHCFESYLCRPVGQAIRPSDEAPWRSVVCRRARQSLSKRSSFGPTQRHDADVCNARQ